MHIQQKEAVQLHCVQKHEQEFFLLLSIEYPRNSKFLRMTFSQRVSSTLVATAWLTELPDLTQEFLAATLCTLRCSAVVWKDTRCDEYDMNNINVAKRFPTFILNAPLTSRFHWNWNIFHVYPAAAKFPDILPSCPSHPSADIKHRSHIMSAICLALSRESRKESVDYHILLSCSHHQP